MAIKTPGEVPPCLYCGSLEPRSEEHVLQAAFGTNLRLTEDVCGICNTERFSAMDRWLVAYVRRFSEAKKHVADLPFKAEPFDGEIGFWLAPEAGFHIAVRAAGKGAPEHRDARLFAQVAFPEDVNRVLARVRAGFAESKTTEARRVIHGPPMLHFNPTVHGGMILRALAKIAINFVCKVLGRALAETPETRPSPSNGTGDAK